MKHFILASAFVLGLTGCTQTIPSNSPVETNSNRQAETEVKTSNTNVAETATSSSTLATSSTTTAGQYIAYDKATYDNLLGKQAFALFFHAEWCPTCRAMEKEINENLSSIPTGTVLLKADYDKETELKKKYNITMQSTVVFIDAQGNALQTLPSPSFADISKALIASQSK